ncbi:MAG TPA: hypothetical protein VL173_17385 [Vicinamibacterales bacterium]|nr:hypothetical protein [Vicinamibacterales bacterium]
MTHLSDDDLVLHHYGELPEADAHVVSCTSCAARARELATVLGSISDAVPERGEHYGLEVWQRIRPHLEPHRPWWKLSLVRWGLAAAAVALIAVSSFVAGRFWRVPSKSDVTATATRSTGADARGHSGDATNPGSAPGDDESIRRVLLLSVADHLERSDRVLTDIMNTPGGADISVEQQWAADLVAANRLYRQDALDADETSVAAVLDELERTLLDIVHRPADTSSEDFDQLRRRIDSAALLFKVRVMSNELRHQQLAPDAPAPKRSTTPIS